LAGELVPCATVEFSDWTSIEKINPLIQYMDGVYGCISTAAGMGENRTGITWGSKVSILQSRGYKVWIHLYRLLTFNTLQGTERTT
jgi:hypothetical protein